MSANNKTKFLFYRIRIVLLALRAEYRRFLINIGILKPNAFGVTGDSSHPTCIVSLTSYGRRVEKVYCTIVSLLRQTMKPDMVILWLDDVKWNEDNIPDSLRKLRYHGLTIKFCKDLKSFKKLIPALLEYPGAMIITCDDDIYYRSNMVERLVTAYKADPTKIYAHRAHQITFSQTGDIDRYNDWPEEISDKCGRYVFPTSGGGTLYTKALLHKDICNENLFMKLSPKADDVWNYFMGFLQGTENVVLPYKKYIYLPLDLFYQVTHKDSNLTSSNCHDNMNDVQIHAIMNHYGIKAENGELKYTPPHYT